MSRCKKTDMLTQAIKKAGGGKVQTSSDTARKLAKEMGGMKKGGAAMPREGISTRPTGPGGRPLTLKDLEKANRDTGGMTAAQIKAAGEAIKRGNRTPYEPIPKKAKGGMLGKVVQAAQAKQGAVGPIGKIVSNPAATQRLPTPVPVAKAPADRALARQEKPEMKPVRRAKGGAGKVRKGMMSKSGDILQAVKPKKGIGGVM